MLRYRTDLNPTSLLMPNFNWMIKFLGAAIIMLGIIAFIMGWRETSNLIMAAGCLMLIAAKIDEWWKGK
jgi:hypothetical protein